MVEIPKSIDTKRISLTPKEKCVDQTNHIKVFSHVRGISLTRCLFRGKNVGCFEDDVTKDLI